MRKLMGLIIAIYCLLGTAQAEIVPLSSLNQITMQISAQQWVNTQTAKVTVTINESLDKNQLTTAHQTILNNLNKITAKEPWQITSFTRSAAQSGLENLQATAQIRLPETELANLRDKAKAISKPGENYTITGIEFTPTLADMETARAMLRARIYNQAKTELAEINKVFPGTNFYLHAINFQSPMLMPPGPMMRVESTGMSVSNNLTLTAQVSFAANTAKNS